MYIKKRNKVRLFFLILIVLGFIYWRGAKKVIAQEGLDCSYHIIYAICTSKTKEVRFPSFWQVIKAGTRF